MASKCRARFLVVLWLITAGFSLALTVSVLAQEDAQTDELLRLNAEVDGNEFLLAEPFFVGVELINTSEKTVIVPYDRYGDQNRFSLRIISEDGRSIERVRSARDSDGARGVRLKPGESLSELINPYDQYAIAAPGEYRVSASFQSDGVYYDKDADGGEHTTQEGWKGQLRVDLGTISIRLPRSSSDKQALEAITPTEAEMPRQGDVKFPFVSAYREENRSKLLTRVPESRYADYARYFQAMDDLGRANRSKILSLAERASTELRKVPQIPGRRIFNEQVSFGIIRSAESMKKPKYEIDALKSEFRKRFPLSRFLKPDRIKE
ncbi:MAG: hypothetical protein ABJM63_20955 [Anderseniella sp.]